MAKIVGNGSNIGGTQMAYLGDEAREAMLDADLIISKGQGNFETLTRAGLNVYYLFLASVPTTPSGSVWSTCPASCCTRARA